MSKTSMTAIALGAFGAALLASAASAAPLNATTIGSAEVSNVDQIGLVCNEYYGRWWRTRGPRYVLRYYYDPSYFPGRGLQLLRWPRLLRSRLRRTKVHHSRLVARSASRCRHRCSPPPRR
jgi:hypothetical protein